MEETLGFKPAPICQGKRCPEKSSARLWDGEVRKDLCKFHALQMWRVYRRDGLEVMGTWNECTKEDFLMPDDEEQQVREQIDLSHPWVEASFVVNPIPVPTQMKWEMVTISNPETGEEQPCAMLVVITQSGVQTYYCNASFFQEFIRQGAMVLAEIGEALQKSQLGKLIVADKGMEQAVINEQRIHQNIRDGH